MELTRVLKHRPPCRQPLPYPADSRVHWCLCTSPASSWCLGCLSSYRGMLVPRMWTSLWDSECVIVVPWYLFLYANSPYRHLSHKTDTQGDFSTPAVKDSFPFPRLSWELCNLERNPIFVIYRPGWMGLQASRFSERCPSLPMAMGVELDLKPGDHSEPKPFYDSWIWGEILKSLFLETKKISVWIKTKSPFPSNNWHMLLLPILHKSLPKTTFMQTFACRSMGLPLLHWILNIFFESLSFVERRGRWGAWCRVQTEKWKILPSGESTENNHCKGPFFRC